MKARQIRDFYAWAVFGPGMVLLTVNLWSMKRMSGLPEFADVALFAAVAAFSTALAVIMLYARDVFSLRCVLLLSAASGAYSAVFLMVGWEILASAHLRLAALLYAFVMPFFFIRALAIRLPEKDLESKCTLLLLQAAVCGLVILLVLPFRS